MAPRRKVHGAQLEIPAEKAAEQRAAYIEARRCTCGSEHPEKWGTRWKHKPPCPRAGKRF